MSVSFNSNVTAGQMGRLGTEYEVQYKRYKNNEKFFGQSDFYGNMVAMGINENKVLNSFEKDMGYQTGSLSWSNSVSNNQDQNNVLFKAKDGSFVDVDFDRNSYRITNERSIAEACGVWTPEGGKAYDIMTVDRDGLNFYEFTSNGLGDGIQDTTGVEGVRNYANKWGLFTYLVKEVDCNYIANPTYTSEGLKGQWVSQFLRSNASQFMSSDEMNYLSILPDYRARQSFATAVYERLI